MWYIVHLSMLIWDWNQLIVSDVINIRNISFNSVLITCPFFGRFGWFMVFNATFNNISVISWPKMEYPWNHRLAASYWQTLSHNVVSIKKKCCIEYTSPLNRVQTHNFSGDRHWLLLVTAVKTNAIYKLIQFKKKYFSRIGTFFFHSK